jgi:5-methylcytosine-specific restriction enzyme A
MPRRAPTPCTHPGCPQVGTTPRCPTHQQQHRRRQYQDTHWVYSTTRWKTLRAQILRESPRCMSPGCTSTPTDVDHIRPLAFGGEPFERSNLQPLCKSHHSVKTQAEMHGRSS